MIGSTLFRSRCLLLRSLSVHIGKPPDASAEIAGILNKANWRDALVSSNLAAEINPDVVLSVLRSKRVDDPAKLLSFFNWVDSQKVTEQKLDSFSFLALGLCSFGSLGQARSVLIRMIERKWPVSEVLSSVARCSRES
ncbi:hypothetical protein HID58_057727 [Brassica napus]|uniref:Pentatricopeptide repeat-containing protein n=1 Tax=Brassica napus TaxID=3708 RepID=A0ABQ7XFE7_BRANA|nr:hypothetical protein HID58_057727 [Brassica napus]